MHYRFKICQSLFKKLTHINFRSQLLLRKCLCKSFLILQLLSRIKLSDSMATLLIGVVMVDIMAERKLSFWKAISSSLLSQALQTGRRWRWRSSYHGILDQASCWKRRGMCDGHFSRGGLVILMVVVVMLSELAGP